MATELSSGILANIRYRWGAYIGLHERWIGAMKLYVEAMFRELRKGNIGVLWRSSTVGDESFAKWWMEVSDGIIKYESTTVVPSLVGKAHGLVLDLGAGTGNQLHRLDASKIKHVYGIESNQAFAGALKAKVQETGLEGLYTPIIGRVEDTETELLRLGVAPGTFDCVLSIQLLCSVKDLELAVRQLHRFLKPGGELIFWEHQQNEGDFITRMAQGVWNVFWMPVIGGCRLNQRTREVLLKAADWDVIELVVEEEPLDLMPRVWGRLKKK